jgi:hypothetical protein
MIDRALRGLVRRRAQERCEYCRLPQVAARFAQFHIEHIVPRQHGGTDDPENLALACFQCNVRKGPNLSGIDPDTGQVVTLFNPRRQSWDEHFAQRGDSIVGLSPTGRATVNLLQMNTSARREIRSQAKL